MAITARVNIAELNARAPFESTTRTPSTVEFANTGFKTEFVMFSTTSFAFRSACGSTHTRKVCCRFRMHLHALADLVRQEREMLLVHLF
jgi:hypothetical protein